MTLPFRTLYSCCALRLSGHYTAFVRILPQIGFPSIPHPVTVSAFHKHVRALDCDVRALDCDCYVPCSFWTRDTFPSSFDFRRRASMCLRRPPLQCTPLDKHIQYMYLYQSRDLRLSTVDGQTPGASKGRHAWSNRSKQDRDRMHMLAHLYTVRYLPSFRPQAFFSPLAKSLRAASSACMFKSPICI